MVWVEDIAAVITSLAILCFILYVIALLQQPTGRRPLITPPGSARPALAAG
jgi:hypothetical protein